MIAITKTSGRLISIDALRGFDMFWIMGADMIFKILFTIVGNEGMVNQFRHVEWNGFRFYDLIFPLFLFIAGISISFSVGKKTEDGAGKTKILLTALKRCAILFFLGLINNGLLDLNFENMRWPGVLQRIAIASFLATLLVLYLSRRWQFIVSVSILLLYWLALMLFSAPGFLPGDLSMEGNFVSYLDRIFIPGRFCCYVFGDNEGLLSTLPSIVSVLSGVFTGNLLRSSIASNKKMKMLILSGLFLIPLSLLWNIVFPINKMLWSSSFVLQTAGWSVLLVALFYWIIDLKGCQKWAFPFIVIGMNPIFIYVAQDLVTFGIFSDVLVHGFINNLGEWTKLFHEMVTLSLKWLLLYFLFRQKIFLKV